MIRFIVPLVCFLAGLVISPEVLAQGTAFPGLPFPPSSGGEVSLPVMPGTEAASGAAVDGGDQVTVRKRDPFWPVGYAPKVVRRAPVGPKLPGGATGPVEAVPEPPRVPQWEEARRKLDVRGISLIGRDKESGKSKYLAMVTGKLVEEGEVVHVAYEGRVYRWKVTAIGPAGVSFQKLDVRTE